MKIYGFYYNVKARQMKETIKDNKKLILIVLFLLLIIGNTPSSAVAFKADSIYQLVGGLPNAIP